MLHHRTIRPLPALLSVLAALAAAEPAYASCTNPVGSETAMIYNGDYHTYQFCNGSSWIAMGGIGVTGPYIFVSTQTANNSATLDFTNLPTSYNTLFVNCSSII